MTRHVLLDPSTHRDLRVATRHDPRWDDGAMAVVTFPSEFRNIQAHYPIVFQKTAEGFHPLALLGLQPGQNLFLRDDAPAGNGWDAWYVPLSVRRQPFLIGRDAQGGLVIHLDLDHPRVGVDDGEALFHPHGGATDRLDDIAAMLGQLHDGMEESRAFVAALDAAGLLESFVLDVEATDGREHRLTGFHAIHEERLRALDGDTLAQLHQAGWLEPAYMAVASLAHLRDLIERVPR